MNIIFVITGLGMGGAETQVCSLADTMSRRGHNVKIIYLYGEKVVSPDNPQVEVIYLGLKKSIISLSRSFFKLVKIIKEHTPDVVHSHMIHANLMVRASRLLCDIPVLITSAHSLNEGGPLRMWMYRVTDFLTDLTTNVGQVSVERFVKVGAAPSNKIISMVNGVNTEKFNVLKKRDSFLGLDIDPNTRILLCVGRNDPAKDYNNLLDSIALLDVISPFKVVIVGKDTEKLEVYAKEVGVYEKLIFLGMRKDVDELMSSADALVMSSAWEGLPMVIGEAMASECNIITTDAGSSKEWLTNNEQPVPIRDSKALAEAIKEKLEQSDSDWRRIGVLNRQHVVDKFSIDRIVDQWLEYYKHPKSAFEND
ncbi:glycosyltransferase [Vibrio sp. D420a]|uniref:glycosyltransferase n=1 Tax=Vibrio sp. D420a TaxID=2836895 RepID=UPI002555DEE8|nr:glycosyltransferase [Vibrio sp. D420a]MDK9762806.1 glycosyltransferase [Vibrio sp. D420a]